uniref:Leucine-rich repeat-containing N-terminal plant-type domain-containing protein n=1 Tax=Triticum urartu TaxID=4572 RepID=A0A8R7TZB9_TRIUA
MKQVKAHYNLTRIDWNGDPCSPREYTWEGLTCSYSSSNKNPRIVRVNLSSSGLEGGLAISLLNMTSLENFYYFSVIWQITSSRDQSPVIFFEDSRPVC